MGDTIYRIWAFDVQIDGLDREVSIGETEELEKAICICKKFAEEHSHPLHLIHISEWEKPDAENDPANTGLGDLIESKSCEEWESQ